ncbi:MAG: OmpH family outer membrane protein [Alphaproteobacteria bacterium]
MKGKIMALAAAAVACVLLLQPPQAAAQAQLNIAVIDPQLLLQNSEAGKSIRTQLDKLRASDERALKAQQDNVTKLDQALVQQGSSLPAAEYQKRAQDLRQKALDLQRDAQTREAKLEAAYRGAAQKLEQGIEQVLVELVKEKGYQFVLRRAAIMGGGNLPDVTPEVLNRINQRMPTVAVDLPK